MSEKAQLNRIRHDSKKRVICPNCKKYKCRWCEKCHNFMGCKRAVSYCGEMP